ncbi:MAG: hypothetical protein RLY70_1414 [Planctomycetota bacterium]
MVSHMTVTNRAALIGKVHKVLKKHYKAAEAPVERTILEHLLYACCLENARPEAADEAFARLQQAYFDWNEVRVTTVAELAEQLANLPRPQRTAQQIKRALQSVFESNFAFDLEPLVKQNLGKSEKDIEKHAQGNPFLIAFVVQHGLGGHSIPCCQGALDALMCLAVVTPAEVAKLHVPGLERAIPKNKGLEFASLLHQLGADFAAGPPFSPRIRQILAEIDPDSKDRLPKRQRRDDELAVVRQEPEDREALVRASLEKAGVRDDAKAPSGKDDATKEPAHKDKDKDKDKDSGGKEASGKDSGSKEASSREHGSTDHGGKDHGGKDHGGKDHGKKGGEAKSKDSGRDGGKSSGPRDTPTMKSLPSRQSPRTTESRSRGKDSEEGKRKSTSAKHDAGKHDAGKHDAGKHDAGKGGKSKRSSGKSEARSDERRGDAKKLAKKKPR